MLRPMAFVLSLTAFVAQGAKVGDTYESVLAEKGTPKSQVQAGAIRMLGYSEVTIKFRDGVVVPIKAVVSTPSMPSPTAGSPSPTGQTPASSSPQVRAAISVDAVREQLKDAIDNVNTILSST